MAMFAPIPLPSTENPQFNDVMDYFEQIQKRKALQQNEAAKLTQEQAQFKENKELERAKLNETMNYHKALIALKNASSGMNGVKLSPQERTQAMKLLEAGRALKSVHEKGSGLNKLLEENPNLTGWIPGAKAYLGKGGKNLSSFIEKAGNVQSAIGRVASQRGGAQVLKWAEKVKPSQWKDIESNKGMVNSLLEDTGSDFDEVKNEYEALTGRPYPIQLNRNSMANTQVNPQANPETNGETVTMYKKGNEYNIPKAEADEAEKAGYSYAR